MQFMVQTKARRSPKKDLHWFLWALFGCLANYSIIILRQIKITCTNVWMLIPSEFIWQISALLLVFLSNHRSSAPFSYCVRIVISLLSLCLTCTQNNGYLMQVLRNWLHIGKAPKWMFLMGNISCPKCTLHLPRITTC